MTKVIIASLLLSGLVFAEYCTQGEEREAEKIFNKSLYTNNFNKKIGLIISAKNICSIALADVELEYLKVENDLKKTYNKNSMKIKLNNLISSNDALDSKHYSYKSQMSSKINGLFDKYSLKTGDVIKDRLVANDIAKAILPRKGTYTSGLTFHYNSSRIKDKREAKEIKDAIRYVLRKHPNARFSITGHSSSGGSSDYNKKLSQRRAASLEKYIGKLQYIRAFSKGESRLICRDGRLPYRDKNREYHCKGGENKSKSRRVVIKRID